MADDTDGADWEAAGADEATDGGTASARYVFGVRFRLDPEDPAVSVDPATFETRLYREADPPGTEGWLFFRDNCWRGELGDRRFVRETAEDVLGVTVESVDFRELRTDRAYLDALKEGIEADPDAFDGASPREVLHKHLGSSIHVLD